MKKKGRVYILFMILIGLAYSVPAIAHADNNSVQRKAQRNSAKKYTKQQKQEKKARKLQDKAVKSWKKRHHAG